MERLPQLALGALEHPLLRGAQALAGAVDVEIEHRHGGLIGRGLPPLAPEGRASERGGHGSRATQLEDARLEVQGVAGLRDVLRPPLRASSRSVLLHAIPPDSSPSLLTHGRKDHAGAEPAPQARQMLEPNEQGVAAEGGVDSAWEGSTRSDLARGQRMTWRRGVTKATARGGGQSSRRYSRTQRSGSAPPSFFTLKRSPAGPGTGVARHSEGFCASCWRNSSVAQIWPGAT